MNEDGDVAVGDEPINAAAFAIHSESMPFTPHTKTTPPLQLDILTKSQSTKHAQTFMQHAMHTPSMEKPFLSSGGSWT